MANGKKTGQRRKKGFHFHPNWQPMGYTGYASYGTTYDAWDSKRLPDKTQLIQACVDISYSACRLVADQVANAKIRLYIKDIPGRYPPKCKTRKLYSGEGRRIAKGYHVSEVLDHPSLDLLATVNPTHTYADLMTLTEFYLDTTGNAYWHLCGIEIDGKFVAEEVYIIPSDQVCLVRSEDGRRVIKYKIGVGNNVKEVPPDRMIHFSNPNIRDPYGEGFSPLLAVWQRVMLSWKEVSYLETVLTNNARPDAIASPENPTSQEEAERMTKEFTQRFRASGNGGIFFTSEPLNLQTLSFSPKDVASEALYKVVKTAISNGFGIPPDIWEIGQSNRSSNEAVLYSLAYHCIRPRVNLIVERLNKWVRKYDDRFFFAPDELVPEDKAFELQKDQALCAAGAITRNEFRTKWGYDPKDWAEEPLLPSGVMPADYFGPAPTAPAQPALPATPDTPAPAPTKAKKKRNKTVLASPRPLAKKLADLFREQEREVLQGLKAFDVNTVTTKSVLTEDDYRLERCQWKAMPDLLIDLSHWDKVMSGVLAPTVQVAAEQGSQGLVAKVGADADVTKAVTPKLAEVVEALTLQFCAETNRTTELALSDALAKLREEIEAGMVAGDTKAELTRRVQAVFTQAERYRAARIAFTETSRAQNTGEELAAIESGVVTGKRWLLSSDACPECMPLANKVVGLGEKFFDSPYPGAGMTPPKHPMCLLGETPVSVAQPVSAMKAYYRGATVRVKLSSGDDFTCTPNHMLLTPHGFARAADLMQGDDIIYTPVGKGIVGRNPNDNGKPALIKDIVAAFTEASGVTTVSVPHSPEYLHGDARFVEGNINVISANGFLRCVGEGQAFHDPSFVGADLRRSLLNSGSDLASTLVRMGNTANGIVGSLREQFAILYPFIRHANKHGLTEVSGLQTSPVQTDIDCVSGYAKVFGDCLDGFTSLEPLYDFFGVKRHASKACLVKAIFDGVRFGTGTASVVSIERGFFAGHVYDLHTESGLYLIGSGVVSSNCRCTMTMET